MQYLASIDAHLHFGIIADHLKQRRREIVLSILPNTDSRISSRKSEKCRQNLKTGVEGSQAKADEPANYYGYLARIGNGGGES